MLGKWQTYRENAAKKRKQTANLSGLWRAHMHRDQKAEREWIGKSLQHLYQKNNSINAALAAAEATAAILFCRWRIFLPADGLSQLRDSLVSQGFYFEPYDKQLVKTLFPDGWNLAHAKGKHIHLVDSYGKIVAKIFYRRDKFQYRATIRPF